jgi:DNA-damage-inducible protein D
MSSQGTEVAQLFRSFEDRRFEFEGTEAWRARELMPLLGYEKWERFRGAIQRAWESCAAAGIATAVNFLAAEGTRPWSPHEVFPGAGKNPQGGRPSEDVILTRRAAYLVAMNVPTAAKLNNVPTTLFMVVLSKPFVPAKRHAVRAPQG